MRFFGVSARMELWIRFGSSTHVKRRFRQSRQDYCTTRKHKQLSSIFHSRNIAELGACHDIRFMDKIKHATLVRVR
jgi:hypothetical protein